MADRYDDDRYEDAADDVEATLSRSGSDEGSDNGEGRFDAHSRDRHDYDANEGSGEDEEDHGASMDGDAFPSTSASLSFGEAILNDLKTTHSAREERQAGGEQTERREKSTACCVCGVTALYTCPGCGRRTCSVICVRVHKTDFGCTGERDVAVRLSLGDFSDQQLQRDFHFLESCRRVVDNVERSFPRSAWRFTYKALPPPLHALREAARRRGVICQITSEGMRKRDVNTSRLDRKTNTIIWRCEFQFVSAQKPDEAAVTIATNWGSERHRLGDVLTYCWATNPSLLCYHINRQYNRAAKYIGGGGGGGDSSSAAVKEAPASTGEQEGEGEATGGTAVGHEGGEGKCTHAAAAVETLRITEEIVATPSPAVDTPAESASGEAREDGAEPTPALEPLFASEEAPPRPPIEPVSPEEAEQQAYVNTFLQAEKYIILAKAERLGMEVKYFQLSPHETLNETMRRLFFVNEFPVFVVVHASLLQRYPLVTEEDKERIRGSFRSRKTQEPREKPVLRKRSDMAPEELERLAKVPCRRFLNGRCALAEECPYWHCTPEEIPVCRSFLRTGQCDKGPRCSFRHDAEAVRIARKRQREDGVEGGFRGGRGGGGGGRGFGGFGGGRGGRGGRGGFRGGFRGQHRRMN